MDVSALPLAFITCFIVVCVLDHYCHFVFFVDGGVNAESKAVSVWENYVIVVIHPKC